ncbi:MAG: HAD family hydrolase [Clostridia bacterium]|nr:HAD family hydrolase [Clostridia bacterium]
MYNTVLFDLDGTLTDPGQGITNSVAHALKKFGIEVEDKKELYKFIGPPLHDSFMKYYGFSDEEAEKAIVYYREYFRDIGIFENAVYDGIENLLKGIKASGRKIILATSKPEEFAVRILVHFGLDKYFDCMAGATMDTSRSKKGDVIAYALKESGCKAEDAVMIGDRLHDILGAKENGLDSIGVLFGYGDREELENAGADYIAETVEDIIKFI